MHRVRPRSSGLCTSGGPTLAIDIRTSAPRWLFERALDLPFSFERVEVDTGVVQVDSLEVDVDASIVRAAAFHDKLDERIDAEARALTTAGAELVVGDIPPLAFAAAARAGIPAMAVGNFTWDWIYSGYPETAKLAPGLVETLHDAYSSAAAALRLPLHGGFGAFETIVDVPLVARQVVQKAGRRPPTAWPSARPFAGALCLWPLRRRERRLVGSGADERLARRLHQRSPRGVPYRRATRSPRSTKARWPARA